MKWIKRIVVGVMLVFLAAFLHYFLPSKDVVRVVGTDVKRMDIDKGWGWDKPDAGTNANETRDVRFINAEKSNGKPRVYRNEDTNWSWPPYFKFDSGDLNAQAQALSKQDEQWVVVGHYGWRIKLFSIFPNAYSVKRVSGPDVLIIPWFNIVFLTILALIFWRIWSYFRGLKKKHVDPVTDRIGSTAKTLGDKAEAELDEVGKGVSGFFKKWFGSSK